jgi:conjugal transfer ATP-binding protein TraC
MQLPIRIRMRRKDIAGRDGTKFDAGRGQGGDALSADERLFALGTRTFADLVAPAGAEVRRDHLLLETQYVRVLSVTGYPRTVTAGWLAPLVEELDLPLQLSLHVRALQSGDMVRALGLQIAKLESSRRVDVLAQRIRDPEREIALEDANRLRESLQRGDERVFSVSLYLMLRAPTLPGLDEATRRVEAQLDGLLTQSRLALFEQERGFRSCLPEGRDQLLVPRNLDTSSLAISLPLASSSLIMERGVLYGVSAESQSPIIIDPFDDTLDNSNLAVVAPSGSGKSYFVKLMALRNLLAGVDFLIIDPEDEYGGICHAAGGEYLRLASSSAHHLNPFDLPQALEATDGLDPLAEQVAALLGLLEVMLAEPGKGLTTYERAALDRALYQTYAAVGITADPSTHDRPAPLMRDLQAILAGTAGELAAGLATRLDRYVSGSLGAGLFAGPTNVSLSQRLVVFNIQQLEEELRPVAIHLIASFVWNRVRRQRRPRMLVIDEAWTLLRYPEGGAFISGLARRARKYYLGLVTIWQKVGDLVGTEHGETVLTNSDMKLLLKQSDEIIEAADARFRFTPSERRFLLGALKGEGLLFARGGRWPIKIEASPAEHRLATTNPRELQDLMRIEAPSVEMPRGQPGAKSARSRMVRSQS